MPTKELAIAERVQPCFIEPMYAEAVRELPDGGLWSYEATETRAVQLLERISSQP